MSDHIRNLAIIAHVDHGKTTLIDKLLRQTGALNRGEDEGDLLMDSNDLEKERGITILAKNAAIDWNGFHINIVDTPGHADFGGEVERILTMVDSVLLLVDAVDGPMPQTRFVTRKAFENNLNPIVMINKLDRQGARPDWVVDQVFELFYQLGASEEQLDFPVVYGSAIQGRAGLTPQRLEDNLDCLLQTLVDRIPPPRVKAEGPFQMQISALDYNSYIGVIGLGRVNRGTVSSGDAVTIIGQDDTRRKGKILQVMGYKGLNREETGRASAGDIICVTGLDQLKISETLCAPGHVEAMSKLRIDEPTMSMTFGINNSPFAGKDGRFVTSRNLKERLEEETLHNVALRVEPGAGADSFRVSGRGELHLAILIENMRREGYELSVSRPQVLEKEMDGKIQEPWEYLVLDITLTAQGAVMEELGERKAVLQNMISAGEQRVRLEYSIPTRGLIGFRSMFLTLTAGTGIMNSAFSHYGEKIQGEIRRRQNGVLISMSTGKSVAFALFNLQARGRLFVGPNENVYEGMIVGLHSRGNDLVVNPLKTKQLTNIRAAGSDENIILTTPVRFTLEQALEFIEDDELVEVTPNHIRVRKKILTESDRKRSVRQR